jgi:thioredoxin-like negative regulator of GroEL
MTATLNVTDWKGKSDLKELITEPGPHLVVLAAKWCGFCSRFIDQAKALQNDVQLTLIDADDPDESLWDDYNVKIVPTLFVFRDGQITFRRDGRSFAGLKVADLEEGIVEAGRKN